MRLLFITLMLFVAGADGQSPTDRDFMEAADRAKISAPPTVEMLLTNPLYRTVTYTFEDEGTRALTYKNQPLNQVLCNRAVRGSNEVSLDSMFTLHQVTTGQEPELITFQLAISYDVLTNINARGQPFLELLLDSPSDALVEPRADRCIRATNGDCLLLWRSVYDPPGQHALQALLTLEERGVHPGHSLVRGPVAPFFSSNICQLYPASFTADGASLRARLPEPNGQFNIEIKALDGHHVRTLTGSTSNGMIDILWDLLDEQGRVYTNDSFESIFAIRLPDSNGFGTLKQRQNRWPEQKTR